MSRARAAASEEHRTPTTHLGPRRRLAGRQRLASGVSGFGLLFGGLVAFYFFLATGLVRIIEKGMSVWVFILMAGAIGLAIVIGYGGWRGGDWWRRRP